MLVHPMCPPQQLLKILISYHQCDRQADGTPQTVPSPPPIPELEHVLLADPKLRNGLCIGAERRKMCLGSNGLEEPSTGILRIRDGLLCRERLACDNKQSAFGVTQSERFGEMGAVYVGDKVSGEVALRVRLEGLRASVTMMLYPKDERAPYLYIKNRHTLLSLLF